MATHYIKMHPISLESPPNPLHDHAHRIYVARLAANKSRADVAAFLCISTALYGYYESGRRVMPDARYLSASIYLSSIKKPIKKQLIKKQLKKKKTR